MCDFGCGMRWFLGLRLWIEGRRMMSDRFNQRLNTDPVWADDSDTAQYNLVHG